MKPAISIALGLAFVIATAGAADAWRAAVGPRGGAAVAGPRGFAARGPNGGVYAGRGYGGAYGDTAAHITAGDGDMGDMALGPQQLA